MSEPSDLPVAEAPASVEAVIEQLEAARAQLASRPGEHDEARQALEAALRTLRASRPGEGGVPCQLEGCDKPAATGGRLCEAHSGEYRRHPFCLVRGCPQPPIREWGSNFCQAHYAQQLNTHRPNHIVLFLAIRWCLPPPDPYTLQYVAVRDRKAELSAGGAYPCDNTDCTGEALPGTNRCEAHREFAYCWVRGCEGRTRWEPPFDSFLCARHLRELEAWRQEPEDQGQPPAGWLVQAARFPQRTLHPGTNLIPGLGEAVTTHGLPAGEEPAPLTEALLGVAPRCVAGDCGEPRAEGHALCEAHLAELEGR